MRDLKIFVCLKVVPKSEEVSVNAETNTLERANARSEINGADMNALQMALELKDTHGGYVTLLSMGPPFAERYLRLGMAMGADSAYLMSDRAFGGADTLPTAYALAEGVRALAECDLIICGEESSDGATGQVPAGLAGWVAPPPGGRWALKGPPRGFAGAPTPATAERRREFLSGTPEEKAEQLLERIKTWTRL